MNEIHRSVVIDELSIVQEKYLVMGEEGLDLRASSRLTLIDDGVTVKRHQHIWLSLFVIE